LGAAGVSPVLPTAVACRSMPVCGTSALTIWQPYVKSRGDVIITATHKRRQKEHWLEASGAP